MEIVEHPMDIVEIILGSKDPTDTDRYDRVRTKSALETSPEGKLLFALLRNAIEIASGVPSPGLNRKRALEVREDTIDWFVSDENRYVFSFVCICEMLNLNPQYVRKKILGEEILKLPRQGRSHAEHKRHRGIPKRAA